MHFLYAVQQGFGNSIAKSRGRNFTVGILDVGCAEEFGIDHGLINFIDTKVKCRHLNKIDL
jgi:hypothetical protein